MKIKLEKLRLKFFKGAKPMEINFSEKTSIYADNGIGKSRLLDAFLWLLFGKDSNDKADFAIKPLDENNVPLSKAEIEVEAILKIDDRTYPFMKVYKEKWQKRKGNDEPELTGHETSYYFEGINIQKGKYDSIISSFIDPEIFKYVTNPLYFESKNWTVKRKILFELANIASDEEIASGNKDFEQLINKLNKVDIVEYKKDLDRKIKAIKSDLTLIPGRIDENLMKLPEKRENRDLLLKLIEEKEAEIKAEESKLSGLIEAHKSNDDASNKISSEILEIDNEINEIKLDVQSKISSEKSNHEIAINSLQLDIQRLSDRCRIISREKEQNDIEFLKLDEDLEKMRKEWYTIRDSEIEISENQTHCPTCKREFENSDEIKKSLKINFNKSKVESIQNLEKKAEIKKQQKGSLLKTNDFLNEELKSKKDKISQLQKKLDNLSNKGLGISSFDQQISANEDYKLLSQQKETLKDKLLSTTIKLDTSTIDERLSLLRSELSELTRKMDQEKDFDKIQLRINQLEEEMRSKSQEIANFQKEISIIDDFTKKKIDLLESSINAKFKYVSFKLYNKLINGENEETCITLVNGVPYHSLNTAKRINAGLDIINVLSEHYNIYAPVWIDNRESITDIQDMNTQVNNLIKETGTKELRIEHE
jgi:DNA repair protein SbcC/Rad50